MKRTLLILCALLAMAYSAGTQAQNVWDGTVATAFAGGSGTVENPYQIANGAQLKRFAAIVNGTDGMARNTAACGKLTADILLNDISNWTSWNENTAPTNSWTPIGSNIHQFTGTLDGDGHSISGIYINNSEEDRQGLVGYLGVGGTIQNLGVKASYIKGDWYVGGVCGQNDSGIMTNCYNTGNVAGTRYVGGVCGKNDSGTVTNCYNTGSVTGTENYVGGVCGQITGIMANCYNTGSVTGSNYIGGVCGLNRGTVTNCYYLTGTANSGIGSGSGTSEKVEPKEADQFQSGAVAYLLSTGENGEIWGQNLTLAPKDTYPVLGGLKVVQSGDGYKNELSQDGDFYLISTADELRLFASMVNGGQTSINAKLTADIELNNTTGWENWGNTPPANSWTPIGSGSQPFTGTLDGDGHSVSGIYISTANYQGLVGYLGEGGTLQNLGVKASYIKGGSGVGGLCGTNMMGTVTNCYNTGSVEGNSFVGGLCGRNEFGTVTNCYNTGSVTGSNEVGGLCGMNNGDTVTNCYNTGSVAGNNSVGGLCGMNAGTVTNCYNTGSVEGYSNVGGLCGDNYDTVTNCYYLTGTATGGIGYGSGEATEKTAEQFASGEVAYLLGEGWGQTIGTDEYPVLGGEKVYQYSDGTYGNTPLQAGEDGFYLISNADELRLFASMVNGGQTSINGKLTADILLNDTTNWKNWETTAPANSWTPIGSGSQPFTGTLDGDGHSVSGIYINSTADCQGFFGATNGSTIINLHTAQGYIRGNGSVGGIVGNAEGGSIEDCTNGCTIASTGSSNGGIVGYGMGVQITGCTNNGPLVAGQYQNGGIAGTVENSTIDQCVNNADITVNDHAGGIAGYNTNGTVSNCLNKGNVNTSNAFYTYTAGIVANNRGKGSVVKNCLNLGTISGQGGTGCRQNSIVCATDAKGTPADNCYSINTSGVSVGLADNSRDVTEEELESGIIANLLQGNQEELIWGQTIGADNSPVLGGPEVFIYGDGTCGNTPLQAGEDGFYLISTADELRLFASMVNGGQTSISAKLTADILLNDTANWTSWNESTAPANTWTPIGSYANPFTGILDGDGHSVSGIYINSEADDQGLVGYLGSGGTLQNLGVKASYIKGGYSVGGLCGRNDGTVTNCYNTGKVTGNNQVGGLCGWNNATVTNCYNNGSVTGSDYVGGVCGRNNATVTNCYNNGSVEGNYSVGGLCGMNEFGTVTNCYNAGNVAGNSSVGGVCGYNNFGTVTNCYYLTGTTAGGIGEDYNSGEATEKTADQFQSGEVAWLLQNEQEGQVWGQTIGTDEYPVLGGEKVLQIGNGYVNELKQDGDFYLISTANELRLFAAIVNGTDGMARNTAACGKLTADILLNDTTNWTSWNETTAPANTWTPIGSGSQPFTGTLDGDGHSVSGIYINSTADYQGLVGVLGSGRTRNIGVKASYIKGGYYVGGVCGYNYGGTVSNCYNTGSVEGNSSVGGLCGMNYGNVINCYNNGNITGSNYVGGVCGYNYGGTVTNCYNTGSVTGNDYVGGLCGMNYRTVTNCYNTGSVEGNYSVGGLCGFNNGGTVTNCYNTGNVTGNDYVGGVCGLNTMGTVINCYNTGNVTGNDYVGGLCGQNYDNVTNCYYLTGTAAGGINGSDAAGQAEAKTETEFASGEVAWLLQNGQAEQVWGQAIGTDESPVWQTEGNKVYKLTLQNGEEANALYANSGNFTLPAPAEREGYTFAGWFTAQADGTQVQDDATLTADLMLYAQWTANSYTVTFEANGGEGSMNQQTFTYDVAQALNQNTFTRTGYSFTGWNTQADGNGSTYGDKAEVLNLTTEAGVNITLYAQWSINSYTIRFVNADGTELQSSEVEYGQTPAYNGETPTKESTAEFDYTFAGWTPQIANVTEEATYKATYTATKRSYTP